MQDFTKFFEILATKISRKAIIIAMAMVLLFLLGANPTSIFVYFIGGLIASLSLICVCLQFFIDKKDKEKKVKVKEEVK